MEGSRFILGAIFLMPSVPICAAGKQNKVFDTVDMVSNLRQIVLCTKLLLTYLLGNKFCFLLEKTRIEGLGGKEQILMVYYVLHSLMITKQLWEGLQR